MVTGFPTLWQYLQSILSYLVPPVVAVFLLGIFWRRATEAGALLALALTIPVGALGWVLVEVLGLFPIQFLYASGVQFLLGLTLAVAGSLATEPPRPDVVEPVSFRWRRLADNRGGEGRGTGRRPTVPALLATLLAVTALLTVLWWW